jgi:hypothetical protein
VANLYTSHVPIARALTKLASLSTLAIAAALGLWWTLGPWLGAVVIASGDGRWGTWIRSGGAMLVHSKDPSLFIGNDFMRASEPILGFSFREFEEVVQFRSQRSYIAASWLPYTTDRTWVPFRGTYFGTGVISLTLPLWLCAVPFAVASYLFKRWHRRQVRLSRGATPKCPTCGYDQSGLAAGAKCPECGN